MWCFSDVLSKHIDLYIESKTLTKSNHCRLVSKNLFPLKTTYFLHSIPSRTMPILSQNNVYLKRRLWHIFLFFLIELGKETKVLQNMFRCFEMSSSQNIDMSFWYVWRSREKKSKMHNQMENVFNAIHTFLWNLIFYGISFFDYT